MKTRYEKLIESYKELINTFYQKDTQA